MVEADGESHGRVELGGSEDAIEALSEDRWGSLAKEGTGPVAGRGVVRLVVNGRADFSSSTEG